MRLQKLPCKTDKDASYLVYTWVRWVVRWSALISSVLSYSSLFVELDVSKPIMALWSSMTLAYLRGKIVSLVGGWMSKKRRRKNSLEQ